MNSSSAESLYQKLKFYADTFKKSNCYWVQILAKGSFTNRWFGEINGKEYSHSRVFKISGDQFYGLLSGQPDSLIKLYIALPEAISDYLQSIENNENIIENSAIVEINDEIIISKRTILNQITFENYSYYLGFDKL